MDDFKEYLIEAGMCLPYQNKMEEVENDIDLLSLAMSIDGLEFIAKSAILSKESTKERFYDYINNGYIHVVKDKFRGKIYASYNEDVEANVDILGLFDKSCSTVKIPNMKGVTVIVANGSSISLQCSDNSFTNISLFDDSVVYIGKVSPTAKLRISKNSNTCRVVSLNPKSSNKNVKIVEYGG